MTTTRWSPTDSDYQAQLLRAHEDLRARAELHEGRDLIRAPVLASWRRSLAALPAGGRASGAVLAGDELAEARSSHLFAAVLPLLRSRLIDPAVEAGLMVALGDAHGRLLWVEGRPRMISRADDMGFAAGADWCESVMGTSAPALALATASPMQVVGAEHFHEAVHPWSCSAVPVLHPHTRETLGVLDVTGGAEAVSPLVLPLLEATARAVQEELHGLLPVPAGVETPPTRRPGILARRASAVVELQLTGHRTPVLRTGSTTIELSGRHAELLTLLHLHPDGISGGELAEQLHGSIGAEGTVRAEVVRLRRLIAGGRGPTIASRPYRLEGRVDSDVLRTSAALERGDLDAALDHCPGGLLPTSEAPGIRRIRQRLEDHLRELLLEIGTSAQLWRFAQRPEAEHDLDVLMTILEHAPADAPERAGAAARARDLRGESD